MPTVREIEQALFDLAPRERAMDWDNVGHLLGDPDQAVERVCVALDITEAVAAEAIENGCQLIVSHHPIMNCRWLPVQNIREDTPQGHLLLRLLRSNVSAICMHTNLDVADGGVNDAFAAALAWSFLEGEDLIGSARAANAAAAIAVEGEKTINPDMSADAVQRRMQEQEEFNHE